MVEEITDHANCGDSRRCRQAVGKVRIGRPYCGNHLSDASLSSSALDSKPEQSQNGSGDHTEVTQPIAVAGSNGDGKRLDSVSRVTFTDG